jgi:hypothetical protein
MAHMLKHDVDCDDVCNMQASESAVPQPLMDGITHVPAITRNTSQTQLASVDSPCVNYYETVASSATGAMLTLPATSSPSAICHENVTTQAAGDTFALHAGSMGISDDFQAFLKMLPQSTRTFTNSGPYPDILLYSNPMLPLGTFTDDSFPLNDWFSGYSIVGMSATSPSEALNSASITTQLTTIGCPMPPIIHSPSFVVNTNMETTTLSANYQNVQSTDPLCPTVNINGVVPSQHFTPPVVPVAAVLSTATSDMADKSASHPKDMLMAVLDNSNSIDRSLGDMPATVQRTKKGAQARVKKGASGKENHDEDEGLKNANLAENTMSLGDGSNDGRKGRKRKAVVVAADGKEGSLDGKQARCQTTLPAHLQEVGYKAPTKGMRRGRNAGKGKGNPMA